MKTSNSLINKEINDINTDGLEDEYEEFTNSSFNNLFTPLERSDYEVRATGSKEEDINKNLQEDIMKNTRKKASYVGQLSSGFDAIVQDDYEAGQGDKGQAGKGHEEEVASKNNWTSDKRNEVGKAASVQLRRTAARLNKLADMLEVQAIDEDIEDDLEEEDLDDDFDEEDLNNDIVDDDISDDDISDEEYEELIEETAACSGKKKEGKKKEAAHPLERSDDSPKSEMSTQTGDEWIDIGSGEFSDKRDETGRAD